MCSFAQKAIEFHQGLHLDTPLPLGIKVLHPFREKGEIQEILSAFYHQFYDDCENRKLILGINPGRLGAGATGIPFTDTKRLKKDCGITSASFETHEPSSVFIYEMIAAFGGVTKFYRHYYIDSVCPLGFIRQNKKGNWVNCNYYDYKSLYKAVKPFIIRTLNRQIALGIDTQVCYVLGKKNARFLEGLNAEEGFFGRIEAFNHPRYIVQYRSKQKQEYIANYLRKLRTP